MKLSEICQDKLKERKLHEVKQYVKRLKWELDEIEGKEKEKYFLDLYNRKVRYPKNENNLLTCWLLDICKDYQPEEEPNCIVGEYPDIDSDFLKDIQIYLKDEWAPKTFGEDKICNISNYTTFGLKSALVDMARVHDLPREEILEITKAFESKDDEGDALSWEAALEEYPKFKEYIKANPELGVAAKRIVGRIRGTNVHAGGLIISDRALADFVPLIKRKDDPQASAWSEGLHTQDLQPVGLIKFDVLVNNNLKQRAIACKLIKERHGLSGIFALPGEEDWTDVDKWRNDPKMLEMANRGDLKCIFQFDSDGIRKMVKAGGVTSFDDLVAYTSLYRPGPMEKKAHERYANRKKGIEKFEIHPLLEDVLKPTYNLLIYQEQCMKALHIVGDIPLKDCEALRKAISKKDEKKFAAYKEQFIKNGMVKMNWSLEQTTEFWETISAFSSYSFNKSHSMAYTYLSGQMACLKAHYPPEFYTAILSCEHLSEKIKEYKMEAKLHGVEMNHVDINKSKETFTLIGNEIQYGFSNIKGIGPEPAKRLVENQPYASFEDFLQRFGTDADIVRRLIALRCFNDSDVVTLFKFAEFVKKSQSSHVTKKKTNEASFDKYQSKFIEMTGIKDYQLSELRNHFPNHENPFEDDFWKSKFNVDEIVQKDKQVICKKEDAEIVKSETVCMPLDEDSDDIIEKQVFTYKKTIQVDAKVNKWRNLKALWNVYQKAVEKQKTLTDYVFPKMTDMNPDDIILTDELIAELRDADLCQKLYYGFNWIHELEKSPSYVGGMFFSQYKDDPDIKVYPVEMKVNAVIKRDMKKGGNFWQIECEDAMSEVVKMNVWQDDWDRFADDFVVGNLLRVRVKPPSGGFPTFTFDSPPRHLRWKFVPKDKSMDFRVFKMKPAVKKIDQILTHEEVMSQFNME